MVSVRRFNTACPDCNRWRCVCDAQCPDCGHWGDGPCRCIVQEDGQPDYRASCWAQPPARSLNGVEVAERRTLPGIAVVRRGPPPPAIRERLEKLRAECAAHLASLGKTRRPA